jgi:hypothetical protein
MRMIPRRFGQVRVSTKYVGILYKYHITANQALTGDLAIYILKNKMGLVRTVG